MIELFEQNIKKNERQSSKGNQLKWQKDDIWYKADYTGYEGLAEYVISHLLEYSTLKENEFVLYDLEEIKYKSNIYKGVKSKSFMKEDWQIITLERLFKMIYNKSLYQSIYKISDYRNRLEFLVTQIEKITGLTEFGKYINKLFTIDTFFLNEDRHMHNIAVLMNGVGQYDYCPIFDNGAGLLSDTAMDYPINGEIISMINEVKAKSICDSFEEQLEISELLYGDNVKFYFTKKNVEDIIDSISIYDQDIKNRVKEIIFQQMRKYQYLIEKE